MVAANLTEGDTLFDVTEAPVIDETLEEFFAGTTRLVNYLYKDDITPDVEEHLTVGWDRSTGLLCIVVHEVNKTSPEGNTYISTTLTLTWTNLWNETTPPQSLPATGETEYLPGVYVGAEAEYNFTVYWESTDPYFVYEGPANGTISLEITDVYDSTVKIHVTQYEEGMDMPVRDEEFNIDLTTGEIFY